MAELKIEANNEQTKTQTEQAELNQTPTTFLKSQIEAYDLLSLPVKGLFPRYLPTEEERKRLIEEFEKEKLAYPIRGGVPLGSSLYLVASL